MYLLKSVKAYLFLNLLIMGKDTGIKGLGTLNKKTPLPKRDKAIDLNLIEKATKEIHQTDKKKKQPTKRVTIDVPVELYKKVKSKVFDNETTNRAYILGLIRKDMGV